MSVAAENDVDHCGSMKTVSKDEHRATTTIRSVTRRNVV